MSKINEQISEAIDEVIEAVDEFDGGYSLSRSEFLRDTLTKKFKEIFKEGNEK